MGDLHRLGVAARSKIEIGFEICLGFFVAAHQEIDHPSVVELLA